MQRTIIFGDIHACYIEWQDLLDKLNVSPKDRLICVGDLVCKGPSTKKVLDLAMKYSNLQCILGNHELALLMKWKADDLHLLNKDYQKKAIQELKYDLDKYMQFINQWPLYIDLPEVLVVHAGIRPGISLIAQDPLELTHLRTLEDGNPWYHHYKDKKLIVHGHWARQGLVIKDNVIGLDSGCVYGKELTAVILPERQIVSVKAHQAYVSV